MHAGICPSDPEQDKQIRRRKCGQINIRLHIEKYSNKYLDFLVVAQTHLKALLVKYGFLLAPSGSCGKLQPRNY